jgi:uncharacterized membrane protein
MPMKKWMVCVLSTIALAALFHLASIAVFPNAMMYFILRPLVTGGKVNSMEHSGPARAGSDRVPMTNPDFLMSRCAYDVSSRPLRVTASVPGTYWSISFYASNTDNYYVMNDEEAPSKKVALVLARRDSPYAGKAGEIVVRSPSDTGLVLVRMLITGRGALDRLRRVQLEARADAVNP